MAITRRRLLASAAALGAVSASAGSLRTRDRAEQAGAHRHSGAALGHCRGSGRERHPRHAMGGRKIQRQGRNRRPQGRTGDRGRVHRPRTRSSASASSCSRKKSTACRASFLPASVLRSGRWSRKPARSRSIGTARRKTASTRRFPIRNISSARPTTNARR